jgi:hypothetical protein
VSIIEATGSVARVEYGHGAQRPRARSTSSTRSPETNVGGTRSVQNQWRLAFKRLRPQNGFQKGRAAKTKGRTLDKTLVLNRLGKSYTEDGLDSSFDHIRRELVAAGKIRPSLTFTVCARA